MKKIAARTSYGTSGQKSQPTEWAVADGKARFSELLAKAVRSPQTITRNGKPVAVVVGINEWTRKTARKGTLLEVLQSAPEGFADLDFSRAKGAPRDVAL